MSTHTLFEAGVNTVTRGRRFTQAVPSPEQYAELERIGYQALYIRLVKEVAALDMYESFKQTGWTERLGRQTNQELMPRIIQAVVLAWYAAYQAVSQED